MTSMNVGYWFVVTGLCFILIGGSFIYEGVKKELNKKIGLSDGLRVETYKLSNQFVDNEGKIIKGLLIGVEKVEEPKKGGL